MAKSGFNLIWLEIRSTRRMYFTDNIRYNVFAVGHWEGHIMDWRGCNFWHKKVSPHCFKTVQDAMAWIQSELDNGNLGHNAYIDGGGHLSDNREEMLEEVTVYISKEGKAYISDPKFVTEKDLMGSKI